MHKIIQWELQENLIAFLYPMYIIYEKIPEDRTFFFNTTYFYIKNGFAMYNDTNGKVVAGIISTGRSYNELESYLDPSCRGILSVFNADKYRNILHLG